MKGPELTCNLCKKRAPLSSMKYSKDGSGLICEECMTKQTGSISLKMKTIPFTKSAQSDEPRKKVSFTCKSCGFRWQRALEFRGPKLCPNCGRDTVVYNLPNDADKLMKELDQMDDI